MQRWWVDSLVYGCKTTMQKKHKSKIQACEMMSLRVEDVTRLDRVRKMW